MERGVALANSRLAKCQSKICRSLDDRYTSLWEKTGIKEALVYGGGTIKASANKAQRCLNDTAGLKTQHVYGAGAYQLCLIFFFLLNKKWMYFIFYSPDSSVHRILLREDVKGDGTWVDWPPAPAASPPAWPAAPPARHTPAQTQGSGERRDHLHGSTAGEPFSTIRNEKMTLSFIFSLFSRFFKQQPNRWLPLWPSDLWVNL